MLSGKTGERDVNVLRSNVRKKKPEKTTEKKFIDVGKMYSCKLYSANLRVSRKRGAPAREVLAGLRLVCDANQHILM